MNGCYFRCTEEGIWMLCLWLIERGKEELTPASQWDCKMKGEDFQGGERACCGPLSFFTGLQSQWRWGVRNRLKAKFQGEELFRFCLGCCGKTDLENTSPTFDSPWEKNNHWDIVRQKEDLSVSSVPMSHKWQPEVLVCPVEACVRSDLLVWQVYEGFQWSGRETSL